MFDAFRRVVNADPALERLGRYYSACFTLSIDGQDWHFDVRDGVLTSLSNNHDHSASDNKAEFTLTIEKDSWEQFGTEAPPPGHHDVSAMIEHRHARLSGDYLPWLANMTFVKGIIRHLRTHYGALCREGHEGSLP